MRATAIYAVGFHECESVDSTSNLGPAISVQGRDFAIDGGCLAKMLFAQSSHLDNPRQELHIGVSHL